MMNPTNVIIARIMWLPFSFAQWILLWSLRYSPPRISISALTKAILTVVLVAALLGDVVGEMLVYKSLTGRSDLRNDSFFYSVLTAQCIVSAVILFKSDSALKRKERLRPE
jgi:hypothetical protein